MGTRYFTPKLFGFLKDLAENNDREWFKANQDAYENYVREPALEFINDFTGPLKGISEFFATDSRTVGGSLFRIQRDTRFSKDKTPYKTSASASFRHERGKDVHAPGLYLHLEPKGVFLGGGIWRPDGKVMRKIRDALVADPKGWRRCTSGKGFRDGWELGGESLKRAPRGYDPEHPLVEDLKRKSFVAFKKLTEKDVCQPGFVAAYVRHCRGISPFLKFLTAATGVPW